MNHYAYKFQAVCPSDGDVIDYAGEIWSETMVMVEEINAFAGGFKRGYHEDIADKMAARFGGGQRITAVHQGVTITTMRAVQDAGVHAPQADVFGAAPVSH